MGKIIRILFIENQPSHAELAMKEITKELTDCEFQRVETELEFLEAVEKFEPDLVLSDYWLPHFSGMRALELLQGIAPLTPLIIYTESKNEDIAVECMKAGAVNYIIKENLKRLGTAVIHALSEKKMQTEQKKAEEKLLDSESKLRKAQHFAHMGSWTWNIKTNHLDWSDEMYNIFGLEKETFSGDLAEVIAQAIHPEDRAAVEQSNLSVITQGKPVPLEYRIIWNDGSVHVVWAEAGEIVLDETGAPSLLSGTVQEITERKRNEEILQKSEASFRSIFEKTATGYVLTALDGRLLKVNAAMADMLGYTMDAFQEVNFQDITHPDDISISAESVRSLLAGEKDTCQFEKRYLHWNSTTVWTFVNTTLVRDEQNAPLYFITSVTDITARKQAEDALQESQNRYQLVFENSGTTNAIFNRECRLILQNSLSRKSLGIKANEALGKTALEIFGPERGPTVTERMQRVLASGVTESFDTEFNLPSGKKWFHSTYQPVFDEQHALVGIQVISQEITERKQVEEKLYLQSAMLEASANAIVITKVDGTIQWANPAFTALTGYRFPEEVFGNNPRELIKSGRQDQAFYKNLWNTILAGKVWHGELVNRRKDGTLYDEEMTITPVRNEAGEIAHFIAVKSDITERKKVEEALRQSEERLRLSLHAANQGLYDLNVQTGEAIVNDEYAQMLGYDPKTFVETNTAWIERLHPDDREITSKAYSNYVSGLLPEYRVEFRQKTKSGNWKWILSLGKVVEWSKEGSALRMLGTHTDITERKQAEELIRQHTSELETRVEKRTADLSRVNADLARALRSRDEFLASVSHELRTPLTGILGLSEAMLLNTYGPLNDRQKNTLSMIEESGRHLLELINDILDLSKIEAGKLELHFAPCILADVCQASLQMVKGMTQHKKQNLHYSPAVDPVMIDADARRLKQILVNLLSNAVKFTPPNGELGLEVQADETEQVIRLIVWDKGIGIKTEDLYKLFKPFVQIDSSLAREYAGSGLGLSLVQRLTEMHNGSIAVESVTGQGSRFIVTLPWAYQRAVPAPVPSHFEPGSGLPSENSHPPLIMLADDHELVLQVIAEFLEVNHYRVIKVRNGYELLERVEEIHPDILLVDIQMPGMDGLETIRRVRSHADPLVTSIPVVAVTALAMPGDREHCLKAGANEYMSKPIRLRELMATIQKLIGNKP